MSGSFGGLISYVMCHVFASDTKSRAIGISDVSPYAAPFITATDRVVFVVS